MITNKGVSLGSGPQLCKPHYSDTFPHNVAWLLGALGADAAVKRIALSCISLIVETHANGSERAGGGVLRVQSYALSW